MLEKPLLLTMSEVLDPFAFFQAESSHAEVTVRADAMRRVVQIMCLMDTKHVVANMLPYLQCT